MVSDASVCILTSVLFSYMNVQDVPPPSSCSSAATLQVKLYAIPVPPRSQILEESPHCLG